MFRSTGCVFLLLLVFPTHNHAENNADLEGKSFLSCRKKSNDFLECVSQSIDKRPVFSLKEKKYIKSTAKPLIWSIVSHSRDEIDDFALSMAGMLAPANKVNLKTTASKTDALTNTLEVCRGTILECVEKDFIDQLQYFIRRYTALSLLSSTTSPEQSRSPVSLYESSSSGEFNHDSVIFGKKKTRSTREIRESITIEDEDIEDCARAVQANLEDNSDVFASCRKIFNRGIWDEKADKTLDGDIGKLITLIYGGERENLEKVMKFIDQYVPKYVRELIVCYDTIISELKRNDDFNSSTNRPYLQRIKRAVNDIKKMNGDHYAEKYFYAKPIHKIMLEDMLVNLQIIENGESISVTDEDIRNCANSVQRYLLDESKILASCDIIFHRGIWDDKADRTLDGDIRKLISHIYDGKMENIPRVLYFINNYVPKFVRELVVSYYSAISEFRENGNFNLLVNQPYILEMRDAVVAIKSMNGDHPAEKFESAKQIHKDMAENILANLEVPKEESVPVSDDDIQNCAVSAKLILENESEVLESCGKVFNRNSSGGTDKTYDSDIRKLISLIYDGKKENIATVIYFIERYVPRFVHERIVSYDAIIFEFDKTEDFNKPENQPYLGIIRSAVRDLKKMNGSDPAANYRYVKQIYKDMLRNIFAKLWVLENESITITSEDIQNCAETVKLRFEDDYEVLVSCAHIFNRGVWDAKADRTLDGDTRKLILLIYDGKRKNILKVFRFIDKYVPDYVRERIVSYVTLIEEFEKHDDFNLPENQLYFQHLYEVAEAIKKMDGSHPAEKYYLALQRHKNMLENILRKFSAIKANKVPTKANAEKWWMTENESITITDEDIRNCSEAVKLNLEDESDIYASCAHIFNRGVWDAKADRTLDGDIRELITLIYDGRRQNIAKVLSFIDKYVPNYVRERIVSYATLIDELEKYDDLSRPGSQSYLQQMYKAVADIKETDGSHPAEKYSLALQRHKDMLENILRIFNKIKTFNE